MSDTDRVHAIPLPAGAEPPIRVYVNGEEWSEGSDYDVEGGWVRFHRPLRAQPPLGLGRKIMLTLGIGVYGDLRGDTLDLQYRVGGRTEMRPITLTGSAEDPPPA